MGIGGLQWESYISPEPSQNRQPLRTLRISRKQTRMFDKTVCSNEELWMRLDGGELYSTANYRMLLSGF